MKLQNKFVASYLLVCMIPVLIVSAVIYKWAASSLEESALEFASLYTSQIETSINNFMEEYDKITKSVLIDNDIISRLSRENTMSMDERITYNLTIERILMRVAVLNPEFSSLMLISRDNRVHQYSNSAHIVNEERLLSQEWYKSLHESKETFFITEAHDRSYYEDNGEGAVFTVARVLLNSDGSYAGVLLVDLDTYQLLKLNQAFVIARDRYDMRVIISTRDEGIVYHSDAVSGKMTWKQVWNSSLSPAVNDKENLIVLSGHGQGGIVDNAKLIVRTEIPRDKLLLKIGRMKYVTIVVIVFCALFIIFISMALSYTIIKPIKDLRRSMKLAEAGQYTPIDKGTTNDEIGSLVGSYNKMIITIKTLIENVYLAEIKQRQAKFLALQNQINPHMLYNTLESIRMKALVKEQDEIADMIKILARMFRLSLGKDAGRHLVSHEVDYAVNYVKLQNVRFGNMFRFHSALGEEVLQLNIIPLVFQPIVENSINHGFPGYSRLMTIVIEGAMTAEGDLTIRIADDGCGMTPEKADELNDRLLHAGSDKPRLDETGDQPDQGIGLINIAERIKLHYGDGCRLTVESALDAGTTVELLIPAHERSSMS
jgi:two-component system sensor histidine kinase YesM